MKTLRNAAKAALFIFTIITGESVMAQDTPQDNKQLIAAFGAEVFGKKDLAALGKYMREDYIQHNALVPQGLAGFRQFFADWFGVVPDWNYSLAKIAAEGDTVWIYGTYSGTLQGNWLGIPGNGKHYSIQAVDIFRVQDGKLAEHWDVIDTYGLFKQLGVIQ